MCKSHDLKHAISDICPFSTNDDLRKILSYMYYNSIITY